MKVFNHEDDLLFMSVRLADEGKELKPIYFDDLMLVFRRARAKAPMMELRAGTKAAKKMSK